MPKVNLGRTLSTTALLMAIQEAHEVTDVDPILFPLFQRHSNGDWGELSDDDRQLNEDALLHKDRVMSVYETKMGVTVWIITDPDWEITTALLPSDY